RRAAGATGTGRRARNVDPRASPARTVQNPRGESMMKCTTHLRMVAVAAAAALVVSGCSAMGVGGSSSSGTPNNVQFIVDTGPGGGSDLFARQLVKIARDQKILTTNWP